MLQPLIQHHRFARRAAFAAIVRDLAVGAVRLPDRGHLRHHGIAGRENRNQPRRRPSARPRRLSRSLSRQPQGRRRGAAIRQGAARHRAEVPGGRRARAGQHRPSRQQGAACRLWAGAGGQRQFSTGLRRPQPRPHPRRSGLADPVGPGRRARSAWPIRGSAAVLCERAEDRARRTFRAVQSRPFPRPCKGSAQGGGDHAPRQQPRGCGSACAAEFGAGGWPAGPSCRG